MRGRCNVIAIKQNIDLIPWADVVYGCDAAWWRYRRGLTDFKGRKLAYEGSGLDDFPDIGKVKIDKLQDRLLFGDKIGSGGNSGFQALNLAVQWGAKRILLIGFDMTDGGGIHWYGRNNWLMANNPNHSNFKRWIAAFETAAVQCQELGVEAINCSVHSAMTCFPKRAIEDVL